MQITKIECLPATFPFPHPFVMSGATIVGTDTIILKIHTDEGITGFAESGDCSEWYMGESQDSVMSLINHIFGPRILLGEDPFNIEKIVAKMDYACKYNNQAKAVVDFALHDLIGKALGVPVYKLLGGLSIEKIPLAFVLGSGIPEQMVTEAKKVLKIGYHGVKVKIGRLSMEEDVNNVRAVREALGPDAKIMVDANAGMHYYQALETLKRMEKYNLAMAEQPLPWWDINGMARLRKKVNVPIFADESAAELSQVMELIEKEAVDGFLLKIPKAGGYLKAQKWVTLAKVAGLPVTCGCLMASGIEAAAQAHFIVATEWMSKFEHENLGPLHHQDIYETKGKNIQNDLVKTLPRYEKGFMYVPEGNGLGVELNDAVITKLITPGKRPTVITK